MSRDTPMSALLRRLRISEYYVRRWTAEQALRDSRVPGPTFNYYFKTSASCPPDTQIQVRGGWISSGDSGQMFYIPAKSNDFAVSGSGVAPAFTNPDWYMGAWVAHAYTYSTVTKEFSTGFNFGYTPEKETVACAEQYVEWLLRDNGPIIDGYPLCLVILRNNGVVGKTGQILPIDATNRGRSYLYREIQPGVQGSWTFWVNSPPAPC